LENNIGMNINGIQKKSLKSLKIIGIVVLVIIFFMLFRFWVIIPPGHVGVVVNFGAVQDQVMTEGFHFKVPVYQKIVKMDCQIQKGETEASAASRDLQTVGSKIAVNYHINGSAAWKLYKNVGLDYSDRIIAPAIQECIKAVTANYTAEQLITKRDEVSSRTKDLLASRLQPYDIVVDRFNIINFQFSKTFSDAVEAKQEAEQRALKANYELQRVKIEANAQIEKAKAEAESLRVQKQEITSELLQLRQIEVQKAAIEKWDGKLPTYTGGSAPIPFIGIGN